MHEPSLDLGLETKASYKRYYFIGTVVITWLWSWYYFIFYKCWISWMWHYIRQNAFVLLDISWSIQSYVSWCQYLVPNDSANIVIQKERKILRDKKSKCARILKIGKSRLMVYKCLLFFSNLLYRFKIFQNRKRGRRDST